MTLAHLAEILEAAARRARELDAESRQQRTGWVDQHTSQLGAKRHCAAVRRLLAEDAAGAAKVGRRHLLSPAALESELQRASRGRAKPASVADELRAELRLVGK